MNERYFYNRETNEIVDNFLSESRDNSKITSATDLKSIGIVPSGATIKDGRVIFPEDLSEKEQISQGEHGTQNTADAITNQQMEFLRNSQRKEIYGLENESEKRYGLDEHQKKIIEPKNEENNRYYIGKYEQAKSMSHTRSKVTNKRARNRRVKALIGAIIVAGGIITGIKLSGVYQVVQTNSLLAQNSDYITEINGFGEDNIYEMNAINKSKVSLPGYASDYSGNYYYDFDKMVSEFLELPDQTFLSNMYTYFNEFDYKYGAFENSDEITNLDHFIFLTGQKVDEKTHPLTAKYLQNCTSWNDFLNRNFSSYQTEENNDLDKIFSDMAESQAQYSNMFYENYVNDYNKNNRSRL